jgi:organic hydroperoxide reductase OsmC/OhrA
MPAPFPHHYRATITRTFASRGQISAPPRSLLESGPSSELDGDSMSWSPEHLLLSSLGMCMLTTFEAFAAREGIEIVSWEAMVNGDVERTIDGLMFNSIVLSIDMEIEGNVDNVGVALEDTKQYCLVLNSLRVPVVIETQIRKTDGTQIELPCVALDEIAQLAS